MTEKILVDLLFNSMINNYDLETVKRIVETVKPNLNVVHRFPDGALFTPLLYAVYKNDIQLVTYLISMGADVNLSTPDEESRPAMTPFQLALRKGPDCAEIAQYLLEKDADHRLLDPQQSNALLAAFKTENWKIVCYLLNHQKYCDPNAKNIQGESVIGLINYLSGRTHLPEDLALELYDSAAWVGENPKLVSTILQWSENGDYPKQD